jgi:hypothetical protein
MRAIVENKNAESPYPETTIPVANPRYSIDQRKYITRSKTIRKKNMTHSSIWERLCGSVQTTHDPAVAACTSHEFARDEEAECKCRYSSHVGLDPSIEDVLGPRVTGQKEEEAQCQKDARTS